MKKMILLMMAFVIMFSLSACGNTSGEKMPETMSNTKTKENVETSIEQTFAPLKIAIVSGPSGINDGSFNQDIYDGVLAYVEKSPGSSVTSIVGNDEKTETANRLVADIVEEYEVIVCCGYQFEGIAATAQNNPDKKFILVDAFLKDTEGNDIELENVYAMQFAEQESGFFAGMAAALETKTGKVAVINGIAFPSNVNYQYGFECGVKYVNETEGKQVAVVEMPAFAGTDMTGADVGGNYIGSFSDELTGRVLANSLIAKGCDVLFVAAGKSGQGVFEAVKYAEDVKVIGSDVDQFDDGIFGKENIVLTSVLKIMHLNVEKQLYAINDGDFKGGNVILYADTDSTGYVSDPKRCQLSKETIEKMNVAYDLIKNGTIAPAANFNGVTPEDFTTKTVEEAEQK